jgi:large subunit ribosomal protein L24
MQKKHSTKWRGSTQPRKQRKYVYNAPMHLLGKFLHVHLSKELRQKHKTRALRVRVGDKVRVVRGTHKGKEGKVERVDVRRSRIYVAKVETMKLQGGAAKYPVRPSNCVLVEIVMDKRRIPQPAKSAAESGAAQ